MWSLTRLVGLKVLAWGARCSGFESQMSPLDESSVNRLIYTSIRSILAHLYLHKKDILNSNNLIFRNKKPEMKTCRFVMSYLFTLL